MAHRGGSTFEWHNIDRSKDRPFIFAILRPLVSSRSVALQCCFHKSDVGHMSVQNKEHRSKVTIWLKGRSSTGGESKVHRPFPEMKK